MKSALEVLREIRAHEPVQSSPATSDLASPSIGQRQSADLFDDFLRDDPIPLAISPNRALARTIALCSDEAALAALTDAECHLPVLFFRDLTKAQDLGIEGLRVLLDTRQAFGPCVQLRGIRGPAR